MKQIFQSYEEGLGVMKSYDGEALFFSFIPPFVISLFALLTGILIALFPATTILLIVGYFTCMYTAKLVSEATGSKIITGLVLFLIERAVPFIIGEAVGVLSFLASMVVILGYIIIFIISIIVMTIPIFLWSILTWDFSMLEQRTENDIPRAIHKFFLPKSYYSYLVD